MEKNRIEKSIELKAPISRVWKALTNYREFGEWFKMMPDGPFKAGEIARGRVTYPGFEHLTFEITILAIEPEHYFSYNWHPYAVDPKIDYSKETPTLVEFRLKPTPAGTLLSVTESGFENIPEHRRAEAFRRNEGGWAEQMKNIEAYVAKEA